MTTEERSEFIVALRKVATVLEDNPDLPVPYFGTQVVRCESKKEFRRIVEAFGGHWEKGTSGDDFEITTYLHADLAIMAYASREKVCTRVVVGIKHVPETVIPAQSERVTPARDEEVVKWVCPSILAETPDGVVGL